MIIEGYMVIFVEIYIYFRVMYLLKSCHRLYFSIGESYVLMSLWDYIYYRVVSKEVYDYIC